MPRRDGTGPMGMGTMTGRGSGFCNSDNIVGERNQGRRFGSYSCPRGYRRQFNETGIPGYLRNNYVQNMTDVDEKTNLFNQEKRLENQLKLVKERLSNLHDVTE